MIARHALLPLALLCLLAGAAAAQQTSVAFGTEKIDTSKPVEVSAEHLDLDQAAGTAVFTGTVRVAQGELKMGADRIQVEYAQTDAGQGGQISRLEAQGAVTVTNGQEAAEADRATYEVARGIIDMQGNVLLTQGPNALASESMQLDLTSGTARFEGRVRTVFKPGTTQ